MDNTSFPKDLLQSVVNDLTDGTSIELDTFEKIARWRRACGDAEGASQWQTWSFLTPEPSEIVNAVLEILENTWEKDESKILKRKLKNYVSDQNWLKLEKLLKSGQIAASIAHQNLLIRGKQKLRLDQLMKVCRYWKNQEKPDEMIKLLDFYLKRTGNRVRQPKAELLISLATLLEKDMRYLEAEKWLKKAHQLEPALARPLMCLARLALRQKQPKLTFHYTSLILKVNPGHNFAARLQLKALQVMDE